MIAARIAHHQNNHMVTSFRRSDKVSVFSATPLGELCGARCWAPGLGQYALSHMAVCTWKTGYLKCRPAFRRVGMCMCLPDPRLPSTLCTSYQAQSNINAQLRPIQCRPFAQYLYWHGQYHGDDERVHARRGRKGMSRHRQPWPLCRRQPGRTPFPQPRSRSNKANPSTTKRATCGS